MGGYLSADLAVRSESFREYLETGEYDKAVDALEELMKSEKGVAAIFYAMRHDIDSNPKFDKWLITRTIVDENGGEEKVTLLQEMFELAAEKEYTKNWAASLEEYEHVLAKFFGQISEEQEAHELGQLKNLDEDLLGNMVKAQMKFVTKLAEIPGTGNIMHRIIMQPQNMPKLDANWREKCIEVVNEEMGEVPAAESQAPPIDLEVMFADLYTDMGLEWGTAEGECDFPIVLATDADAYTKYLIKFGELIENPDFYDMMMEVLYSK